MALTQIERIRLIENVMCQVSKLPYIGGYAAINEVSRYLRASIEMPSIPVISQHISTEQSRMLKGVGITLDDIRLAELKRAPNRSLIHRSMIEILVNLKYLKGVPDHKIFLDISLARDIFLNILEDKIINPYAYLSKELLDVVKEAEILVIDTEWVFQQRNLEALSNLINHTNLDIADAFFLFDTLTISEKEDLILILNRHLDFARSRMEKISKQDDGLQVRVEKIERFLHDAAHAAGNLPDSISEKFLNIVCTEDVVSEYVKQSITLRLEDLQTVYSNMIETRDTNMALVVKRDLSNWLNCKVETKNECWDKLHTRYPHDLTTKPNTLSDFIHTTLNLPTIEAISYTDAFAVALSCYTHKAAEVCHSIVATAINSTGITLSKIQSSATKLLPAAAEAGVNVINTVTNAPSQKSSSSPYLIAGVMVAGFVSFSAVACYCLFKPKKDKFLSLHVDADLARESDREDYLPESHALLRGVTSEEELEHNAGKADAMNTLLRRA
jgi:hypothetical protein